MISIVTLIVWIVVGVLVIKSGSVDMLNYVMCWGCLILSIIQNILNKI